MKHPLIPQEKNAAVARGLREAFGVEAFDDIRVVTGGHTTSLVFRIVVQGSPYLLKIILRTDDPSRHFASMKAAAEAGIAPRVLYTSTEDRLLITDFVESVALPTEDALLRAPALLRSLHALPPFGKVPDHINTSCMFLLNEGPALEGFLQRLLAINPLPADQSEEFFAVYRQVAAVYPRDEAGMVSSHNDLFKPDNLLFDGNRVWLVDWEAAFLNDPYADLAVVANLLVTNDVEERVFLQEYFGQPPDEYQRARLFLLQQITHVFYAMAYLFLGSVGAPVDWSEHVPGFRDLQRRIWERQVDLADKPTKIVYGRAHLEQLFRNTRQARFKEALRIVAGRHACP